MGVISMMHIALCYVKLQCNFTIRDVRIKQRSGSALRIEPLLSDDGQLYQPACIIDRLTPPDQVEKLMSALSCQDRLGQPDELLLEFVVNRQGVRRLPVRFGGAGVEASAAAAAKVRTLTLTSPADFKRFSRTGFRQPATTSWAQRRMPPARQAGGSV